MNVNDIIDGIIAKKSELGMTSQQLADASNVPKSTVDRILRKGTENPSLQTVLDLAGAVGYQFGEAVRKPLAPVPDGDKDSNPYLQHIIAMYERQLSDKETAHSNEVAKLERHYNLVTSEKNRWITILGIITAILVTGIFVILLIDITNPTVGWYRRELSRYTDPSTNNFGNWVLSIREWFGL